MKHRYEVARLPLRSCSTDEITAVRQIIRAVQTCKRRVEASQDATNIIFFAVWSA